MEQGMMRIENERFLIRNLEICDLEGLKIIRGDEKVYRYEPTFLMEIQGTPEDALEAIRGMNLYESRQCIMGVYEKTDTSHLVGLAEFYDYKPSGKVISLGYRFLSQYWGRGIATSCIQAMIDYIKNHTDVQLITAHVLPDNMASSRCLIKNGFEYLVTKEEDWGYDSPSVADVYTFDC
jgi:ribosomal-protein-alanine N-acetyltransferase